MKIKKYFSQHQINLNNKTLIVACSGGPDSIALVDMLYQLKKESNFKLIVAHFDHQLRDDSHQETLLLKKYCLNHKLQFENGIWNKDEQPKSGVEAEARKYRYDFLTKVVRKNDGDYLLTAHHGDDLLENILLKFIRSGNPQEMNSLQAMGTMNGIPLLRPLLTFSKEELLKYDHDHQLEFIHDATNDQDDVLRNRLRHHVVPLLKKENSEMIKNALRYSEEMTVLETLSKRQLQEIGEPTLFLDIAYCLPKEKLARLSEKERLYYWRHFIWKKWHRRTNENLANFNLVLYQDNYYLWPDEQIKVLSKLRIKVDQAFEFRKQRFLLSSKDLGKAIGDFWADEQDFYAGSLPIGCKLPLKNGEHAKAKKMFAKAKIPSELRPLCLTIFAKNNQPIFIEKTYQDQSYLKNGTHYYLYHLKKG